MHGDSGQSSPENRIRTRGKTYKRPGEALPIFGSNLEVFTEFPVESAAKSNRFSSHYKQPGMNKASSDNTNSGRSSKAVEKFSARGIDRKKFKGKLIRQSGIALDNIDEESGIGIDSAASFRRPHKNTLAKRVESSLLESAVVAEEAKSSARMGNISAHSNEREVADEGKRRTPEMQGDGSTGGNFKSVGISNRQEERRRRLQMAE